MRVLVAHNRYQSAVPSGENRVVDAEIELLRAHGVDVVPFIKESDDLLDASVRVYGEAALGPVWAPSGVAEFRRLLERTRPDVVHLHNVFPFISPWVVRTAHRAGVPIVQTVHNYRHTCVAGLHLRDGEPCQRCLGRSMPSPAVRYGCYRTSRVQSAAMVVGQMLHRSTWRLVDRFLITSPVMAQTLVSVGINGERIVWRPTFAEDVGVSPVPVGGGVVFVGRLEAAKGIEVLLDAWTAEVARRWGRLVVVGDGPLAATVRARASVDATVEWLGQLLPTDVRTVIDEARLVAIPSLCLEGFPRVAAEAMAAGRPLLMSSEMGFSGIAADGVGWTVGTRASEWIRRLSSLDTEEVAAAGTRARRYYEEHCEPASSMRLLEATYEDVVAQRARR